MHYTSCCHKAATFAINRISGDTNDAGVRMQQRIALTLLMSMPTVVAVAKLIVLHIVLLIILKLMISSE